LLDELPYGMELVKGHVDELEPHPHREQRLQNQIRRIEPDNLGLAADDSTLVEGEFQGNGGVEGKDLPGFQEHAAGAQVYRVVLQKFLGWHAVVNSQTGVASGSGPVLEVQQSFYCREKVVASDRLEEDGVATGLSAEFEVFLPAALGDHDYGNGFELGITLDPAAAFVAAHPGHVQIHQDNVGLFLPGEGQRLGAVAGDNYFEFISPEKAFFQFDEQLNVIGKEDFFCSHAIITKVLSALIRTNSISIP
jgi:hypothetical protein